jgi:hypothetical protein
MCFKLRVKIEGRAWRQTGEWPGASAVAWNLQVRKVAGRAPIGVVTTRVDVAVKVGGPERDDTEEVKFRVTLATKGSTGGSEAGAAAMRFAMKLKES